MMSKTSCCKTAGCLVAWKHHVAFPACNSGSCERGTEGNIERDDQVTGSCTRLLLNGCCEYVQLSRVGSPPVRNK